MLWAAIGIPLLVLAARSGSDSTFSVFSLWPLVFWPLFLLQFAFSITAAVRMSKGVWWRYPISIRFVRGAKSKAEIAQLMTRL